MTPQGHRIHPVQYTLRTLLILQLTLPPALGEFHAMVERNLADQLLPSVTSGWNVEWRSQSLCLTVTPGITIQEEEEGNLGLGPLPCSSEP